MKKARKNYSPQEKVAILRSHLVDKVSALQLCTQFQLQPKIFYRWLKQLFDNGPAALERRPTIGKRPGAFSQPRSAIINKRFGARDSKEAEQDWMISLAQGRLGSEQVKEATSDALGQEDVVKLLACIHNEPLKYRNRAVALLSYYRLIRVGHIASFLRVSHSSVDEWIRTFAQHGCQLLLPSKSQSCKANDPIYRDAVFEILHAPPSATGSTGQPGGYRIFTRLWRSGDYR